MWILRTGVPWRDLPEEFGAWQTAWRLFDQWNGDGTLDIVPKGPATMSISRVLMPRTLTMAKLIEEI